MPPFENNVSLLFLKKTYIYCFLCLYNNIQQLEQPEHMAVVKIVIDYSVHSQQQIQYFLLSHFPTASSISSLFNSSRNIFQMLLNSDFFPYKIKNSHLEKCLKYITWGIKVQGKLWSERYNLTLSSKVFQSLHNSINSDIMSPSDCYTYNIDQVY